MTHNRYPGPKPFPEDYRSVFFGRDKEIGELLRMVRREPWLVLYGKSGQGKSSLLNAGLAPLLLEKDKMQSVFIRFNACPPEARDEEELHPYRGGYFLIENKWTLTKGNKPVEKAFDSILSLRANTQVVPWLNQLQGGDRSLWRMLKETQITGQTGTLLLIFDQFEELFTYPPQQIQRFAENLAEVFYSDIPERYRKALEQNPGLLSQEQLRLLHEPLRLRVITAIRTDRMALMHQLKPFLPNTLDAVYELKALSRAAAEEAVLNPAYDPGAFATPRFDYEDEALDALLDFLSAGKTEDRKTEDIESFQLQILCEHLEKNVVERAGRTRITAADIADPERILEDYYLNKIEEIPDPITRLAARRLIEEGLIFEEEERRLTLFEGQILRTWGVDAELLARLEDTHLLRREPSLRGGYTYELSHDTLVAPVLKAKSKRMAEERREQEAEADRLREAELAAAKAEAAREKRRRQRSTQLAWAAALAAVLALGAAGWAWIQTQAANKAKEDAVAAQKDAEKARKIAEANFYVLQMEQAKALEIRGDNFFQYGEYGAAKYEYEQARGLLPQEAAEQRKAIEEKITKCENKLRE